MENQKHTSLNCSVGSPGQATPASTVTDCLDIRQGADEGFKLLMLKILLTHDLTHVKMIYDRWNAFYSEVDHVLS